MAEKVAWGVGREAAFVAWIDKELIDAKGARQGLEQQWRDWLAQYRVSAKQPLAKFPFEGASNTILPTTAVDVDVLFARFVQTMHAPPNIWTVLPLNERWVDAAKPLQDWLQVLDDNVLRLEQVNERAFLEMVKLGTTIYKTGWTYERRSVWTYNELGKRERRVRIISKPFVDHVKLADFLLPGYATNIQPDDQGGAPWVAERLRLSVQRLKSLADASEPFLPNIDKQKLNLLVQFVEADRPPHDAKIEELDFHKRVSGSATKLEGDDFDKDKSDGPSTGPSVHRPREIELWEIHARFPTKGADSEDDIIVWYHEPTRMIVRAIYQPYHHGQRPYEKVTYFPGDGFYGIGLCEQKEVFQKLQSDLFNFTHDNVLLANSRMIVAKSGANIMPGEPIYPYKVWLTDGDVRQDFGVFPMADIYQSLPLLQNQLQALGERRTGISDIQLGNMQQLPGRTPATTMLSLLQEGNRRPDLTIKSIRRGLSNVGLRVLQLCQQFISSPVDYEGQTWLQLTVDMLGMPEGAAVAQKLMTPLEPAELGVGVTLTATSGSANKEVERQGAIALLQLGAQIAPQFIQLIQVAEQAQGSMTGQVALQAAVGLQELYKRTLEQHDIRNLEAIVPLVDQLASQAQGGQQPAAGAPAANGGGLADAGIDPQLAALFAQLGGGGGATGF